MTLFVDASALVAIIKDEPEAYALIETLQNDAARLTSGMALWETVRAVAKLSGGNNEQAWRLCEQYRVKFGIGVVAIGLTEAQEAFGAHSRYGKGAGHPARLNMGDCFAYACAKTSGAKLLYKGDDFIHTDLR